MAVPTLVATAGSASANSYATVAESTTYHESHLYASDWLDADTDTQTVALIMATRLLDAMVDWTGAPTDSTVQALRWPRISMYDRDDDLLDSATIPQALKDATSEFARQLIVSNRPADNDIETQGLKSLTAGAVSLVFSGATVPKVVPDAVWYLLVPSWGSKRTKGSGAVTMERG